MSARVLKSPTLVVEVDSGDVAALEQTVAEAYEQGRADGAAEAGAALQQVVADLIAAIETTGEQVAVEVAASCAADSAAIVDLGATLAEWYLGAALPDVRAELVTALTAAATELDQETDLVAWLAPETAALVEDAVQLPVRADASLGPADFRLSSSASAIERSWEEALERVRPTLEAALEPNHHDD